MSRIFGRVSVIRSSHRNLTPVSGLEWLGGLINITKMTQSASDLAPFPYLTQAFGIVITLLEVIQQIKKNRDDLRELAESIVDTIVIVRDEILAQRNMESSLRFHDSCKQLLEYLTSLLDEIKGVADNNRNWIKQYLRSTELGDAIARHQRRANAMRANFMLGTAIGTRMQLRELQEDIVNSRSRTASVSDDEVDIISQNYHSLILGDIRLLEKRTWTDTTLDIVGHCETTETKYCPSDYIATVRGETKTVRIYEGQHAIELWLSDLRRSSRFRHPNVMQLFGICKSSGNPALVFHGNYTTLEECFRALDSFEKIQFLYRMAEQYQAAWSYLKQWLPQCGNCDCLEPPASTFGLCTIGCFCSHDSFSVVDHDCQFLVDTDTGKGCVLVYHRKQSQPYFGTTAEYYESGFPDSRCLLPKSLSEPFSLKGRSSTSVATLVQGFFRMVSIIRWPEHFIVNKSVAIGDLQVSCLVDHDSNGNMHTYSPGRLLTKPPLPYTRRTSRWRAHCPDVLVSHTSDQWSRFSITRLRDKISAMTDVVGLDSSTFMVPWILSGLAILTSLDTLDPYCTLSESQAVTGVRGLLKASATFTSDSPEVVYLFVRNLLIDSQGIIGLPDFFWSIDPLGRDRFSGEEVLWMELSASSRLETDGHQYPIDVYKGLKDLCGRYGTQLDPTDIFRFLELSPVFLDFLPSEAKTSSCQRLLCCDSDYGTFTLGGTMAFNEFYQ